jgi:hypothetical protein
MSSAWEKAIYFFARTLRFYYIILSWIKFNPTMEQKTEAVFVFNSAAKILTYTYVQTQTYSGGKINAIWEKFKTWDWGDAKFNDKNHSITRTVNSGPTSVDENWLRFFQINQNGKKIKMLSNEKEKDLIMSKQ